MKKRVIGITICVLILTAGIAFAQTEEPGDPPVAAPEPISAPAAPDYKNFTTAERWGTWALNYFVLPGLGSYMIMQDVVGGTIQMAMGGVETGLGIAAIVIFYNAYFEFLNSVNDDDNSSYTRNNDTAEPLWSAFEKCLGLLIASAVLATSNTIFNIVRSATYDRPQPKVGSLADPNAWSLVVLPGANGVEQVRLAYTLRF